MPVCGDPGPKPLRIGLVRFLKGVSTVELSCSVDFTVTDGASQKPPIRSAYLEPISLFARKDGIEIKKANGQSTTVRDQVRVEPVKTDGLLTVSAPTRSFSQYRGALLIKRIGETGLLLVNEVQLEDYLKGVLPAEMGSSFQMEALKAQAVAARTYSERMRARHEASGYDLCDSNHCQVYVGSGSEAARTTRAVLDTQGLVAKYAGKLIYAVYSADCGGCTETGDGANIDEEAPYLRSRPDNESADKPDFCSINRTHAWTREFAPEELEAALNARLKPPVKGLKSIAFCEYDASGRVSRIDLVDGSGARTLTGYQFRMACGPSVIRSTKMTFCTTEDGRICFEGKGWGHGSGMCQWGAEGLARPPLRRSFSQILKHYYSGIEIVKLR